MHVLLASEANEGLGHIAPWAVLVKRIAQAGHRVSIACPHPELAKSILGKGVLQYHQAWWPSMHAGISSQHSSHWEDLLWSLGYGSARAVFECLQRWLNLMQRIQPTVVLADYAPLAMIASRTLGIPVIEAGGGFCVPPNDGRAPIMLPSVRNLDEQSVSIAQERGQNISQAINHALKRLGAAWQLNCFADIFRLAHIRCVTTMSFLDHYLAERKNQAITHLGHLEVSSFGAELTTTCEAWVNHKAGRKRMLCYLKSDTPRLLEIYKYFAASSSWEILILGKLDRDDMEALSNNHDVAPHIHIFDTAVNLAQALPLTDVFVTNGGIHSLSHALDSGCLCLLIPSQMEQAALALQLAQHPQIRIASTASDVAMHLEDVTSRSDRFDLLINKNPTHPTAERILMNQMIQISRSVK
jgi:UDP:flavonoid glycosyltransferase YjiC (YdhE family)